MLATRLAGELGAHPRVRVERLEDPEHKGPDRLPRLRITDDVGHHPGGHVAGGRREQFVLVGDMPVDRPAL